MDVLFIINMNKSNYIRIKITFRMHRNINILELKEDLKSFQLNNECYCSVGELMKEHTKGVHSFINRDSFCCSKIITFRPVAPCCLINLDLFRKVGRKQKGPGNQLVLRRIL